MSIKEAKRKIFDPEGSGYDYETAIKHGLKADETGHWPSRVPETGQLLKGRKHSTWHKTEKGEREAGYKIYKHENGRYYSNKIHRLVDISGGERSSAIPIKLSDIPRGQLNPEEVEALSNKTFDYADKERVSMREAERKIKEETHNDFIRRQLMRAGEFEKAWKIPSNEPPYTLEKGFGEFTFKEKALEVGKAVHRGLGSIVKLPGIALKAIGERAYTRAEIEELKKSPYAIQRFRAKTMESPVGKGARGIADMLRRAGNKYIEVVNGMMIDESPESRAVRSQAFMEEPAYRTLAAAGESVPTYGLAIASTLTSGNPNIGLFVLGTTTASSSYENLRQQGVDPDLALVGASLEGSIEMITEKVPMDVLMKGAGRPLLIRALHVGSAESFQELLAQLGQNYVSEVVKEVDPEDYSTALQAARQEWGIIKQGWEDAMAAGFLMGAGGGAFVSDGTAAQDLGLRTAEEMRADYGFVPRNVNELISLTDEIKKRVKDVEKEAKSAEKVEIKAPEPDVIKDVAEKFNISEERAKAILDRQAELQKQKAEKPPEAFVAPEVPIEGKPSKEAEISQPMVKGKAITKPEAVEGKQTGEPEPTKEIGEGEEKPRGTSVSVMAQAIEDEIVEEHKVLYDEIPTYKAMNMKEQAEKALALIESDIEKAKRVAFIKEPAPPDLYPENVFSALRTYAKMTLDVDLIMDLALNEDVAREHTILGKRIKSLDTDQDYGDPVRAIREVVETRMERKVRKGEDVSALEVKLRELQAELDKVTKERAEFTKKAERTYGKKNKLVARTEYDSIMTRRKKEAAGFAGRAGGMAYVPTAQDFADIAKIATFHLEAMGRDFAKWSYQMTKDFGDWITPHLQDEYEKAIAEAKKAGVEIKEPKRLTTKKKRLATTTKKIEAKLKEQDLAKAPRIPIELDEEGQRLQDAYDIAREKYKAAQAVANIITEKEVQIIAQLAKDAAERKAVMEKSERRKEGEGATQTELEYGTAISMFLEYVNDLKVEANKRTMGEVIKNYLKNPVDFISDFAGTLKAAKASLDNSFHLRQGLPTFLKAITGHIPSAKIWWKTFIKSWKMMWQTLRKKKVMRGLFAEMISDPDYELLKKSKVALNVIEEEIPVDIPSRIPLLGMLFRMGENAFVGSSRYMRYQLAKQYLNVWRKSGVELNKRELESIGRLANSQTGRGEVAGQGKKPGLLNNVFWSPRNLRAYVDILTVHAFDRNISLFARKQAAINLLRYVSGAAMILALAKWIDDDSVTWDTKSSDFGKIRVGNTRFSVGGGMAILVILASRLINREFTSSTTGETKSIDTGKYGALGGKDLVWNFVENKLSPAAGLALSIIDQKTWDGDKLTIPQMVNDALTPLIIQNVFETGSSEDSANVLAALIAEAMGVNVQTYSNKKKQKTNMRTKL